MKRLLSLLLCLAMLFSFVACSSIAIEETGTKENEESTGIAKNANGGYEVKSTNYAKGTAESIADTLIGGLSTLYETRF